MILLPKKYRKVRKKDYGFRRAKVKHFFTKMIPELSLATSNQSIVVSRRYKLVISFTIGCMKKSKIITTIIRTTCVDITAYRLDTRVSWDNTLRHLDASRSNVMDMFNRKKIKEKERVRKIRGTWQFRFMIGAFRNSGYRKSRWNRRNTIHFAICLYIRPSRWIGLLHSLFYTKPAMAC